MKILRRALSLALLLVFMVWSTAAFAISLGLYNLANHPDGNEIKDGGRPYGLRLDGLGSDLPGMNDYVWTFDFDDPASNMMLEYTPGSIRIFGQTIGGIDNDGADYKAGSIGLWGIDMTYDVGISEIANGGVSDTRVEAHHDNFGLLTLLSDNDYFSADDQFRLRDHSNNTGVSLKLGDGNGGGFRGFPGISGTGWLDHKTRVIDADTYGDHPSEDGCCSDWLFTATKTTVSLPEPGTFGMLGLGMVVAMFSSRRKRHTAG